MKNTLQKDFLNRVHFFANRSSAIFPILFLNKDNDLILTWLNYWKIKNKIDTNFITINIRIYDNFGKLFLRKNLTLNERNNFISIRKFIKQNEFQGMVEIEIISTSNIKFVFPAINGLFKSGSLYSCVHSAGRIKGSDEIHNKSITEETNWTCKFSKHITPFFHYINGNKNENTELKVNLYNGDGNKLKSCVIKKKFNAFGSQIYFLDKLFNNTKFKEEMFCGVVCKNDNVFRRMVVGNFHKNLNHLEVTHSFPFQKYKDFCPSNRKGYESFLTLLKNKNLDLECRIFPTNCSKSFKINEANQNLIDKKIGKVTKSSLIPKGHGLIKLDRNTRMKVLLFSGSTVPSRLNTSFIYKVNNIKSNFSTDIATGAKSSVYPQKFTHWGTGLFGGGYDFTLMVRNISHDLKSTISKGDLYFFGLDKKYKFKFKINSECSESITLSDLIKNKSLNSKNKKLFIFNWLLKLDKPNSETFWVSFHRKTGCILGDHGF